MEKYIQFVVDNWYWMAPIVLFVLTTFLNVATKHYSEQKGLLKALTALTEIFSFLTSKGSEAGVGPLKKFKLPGQDIQPKDRVEMIEDALKKKRESRTK